MEPPGGEAHGAGETASAEALSLDAACHVQGHGEPWRLEQSAALTLGPDQQGSVGRSKGVVAFTVRLGQRRGVGPGRAAARLGF